jgi:cytochrome b561
MSRTSSRASETPIPKTPGVPGTDVHARYTRVAVWLHWLIALALLGQIGFGFLLDDIAPRHTPARSAVVNLHKSCGIVLGVLILTRLAWRLFHAPPPWPASMTTAQRLAARGVHIALYVCMVVMPLSGYVASNFNRFGITFFGFAWPPWGPPLPGVYDFLGEVHGVTAVVFCVLIAGHVLAALKHALIDRDHVFSRMLM